MSFIYGLLYLFLCTLILCKFLYDGTLKLMMVMALPIAAFYCFSIWYAIFGLGFCLAMGLGKPMNEADLANASLVRRRYGSFFDTVGFILMSGGLMVWVLK